jgi:hypothetical protein
LNNKKIEKNSEINIKIVGAIKVCVVVATLSLIIPSSVRATNKVNTGYTKQRITHILKKEVNYRRFNRISLNVNLTSPPVCHFINPMFVRKKHGKYFIHVKIERGTPMLNTLSCFRPEK